MGEALQTDVRSEMKRRALPWAILVIDDERDATAEMVEVIAGYGYRAFGAVSLHEARTILESHSEIAVIVCDIRMPGENGLDFLNEVSKRQGMLAVRTLMVTGYATFESVVVALRNRAFDFLTKPLSRESLLFRIDDAMAEIALLRADDKHDALALKNIMRKRATRAKLFEHFEYSEAAWDILIELTAAKLENRRLDVSGLSLLTHVSRTTAWRTIQTLVTAGMLVRVEDPEDRRRVHIELVDQVFDTIRDFAKSGAI